MRLLVCSWQVRGNSSSERIFCVNFILVYAFNTAFRSVQDNSIHNPPRTVFIGETVELECDIQLGRARELYSDSVEWRLNNQLLSNQEDFSLSVSVESVSQNGDVYQCSVEITSCSPISTGCSMASRVADGNSTTLVVGGE